MSLVVLGMHRSGTSLLIGLLQTYGYVLGNVSEKTSMHKPTGTKENLKLREINNKILNFNNSSWDSPKEKLIINKNLASKISSFSLDLRNDNWAIKDPRLVLTYKLWEPYLPKHKVISTIRHPWEVANSLLLKNGIKIQQGLNLWYFYNRLLLSYWQKSHFPILNFNTNKKTYYKNFASLGCYLNIMPNKQIFDKFYQHLPMIHNLENKVLSPCIDKLYKEILFISRNNYE